MSAHIVFASCPMLVAAFVSLLVGSTPASGKPLTLTSSANHPDAVTLVYDATDGRLTAFSGQQTLRSLGITSTVHKFQLDPNCPKGDAGLLDVPAYVCDSTVAHFRQANEDGVGVVWPQGFSAVSLGRTLPAGLSADEILAAFDVGGTLLLGEAIDARDANSPYLRVVPEPNLTLLPLLALAGMRRRRRAE